MSKKQQDQPTTDNELLPIGQRQAWRTAPSLKPDQAMMLACCERNKEAMAIRDSWRFQRSKGTILRTVSAVEWQKMVDRYDTFGG
jgi:hypothetical protein